MPRGPLPKPEGQKARTNPPSLPQVELGTTPAAGEAAKLLSGRELKKLHKLTRAWWKMLLAAPQASEYVPSDWNRLRMVVLPLVERYNLAADAGDVPTMTKLAGEIRQQEADFGLTPAGRLRNRWTVRRPGQPSADEGESGNGKTRRRRRTSGDPRLEVVK